MPGSNSLREAQRASSEAKILSVLEADGPTTWSSLKTKTGLGPRTLSERLKGLQQAGAVRRTVSTQTYPPTSYYEATSAAVLSKLPPRNLREFYSKYLDDLRHEREIFTYREKTASPGEVIKGSIEDFVHDILFTLNFAIEKSAGSPLLVLMHVNAYHARLENLMSAIRLDPEYASAAKDMYKEFREERTREENEALDNATRRFSDKPLARAALLVFFKSGFMIKGVSSPEFLKMLAESKELQITLEKEAGFVVKPERLQSLLTDVAWNEIGVQLAYKEKPVPTRAERVRASRKSNKSDDTSFLSGTHDSAPLSI